MTIPLLDASKGEQPGLRTRIWIQGYFSVRDPRQVDVTPRRMEVQIQTSSLGLRADRAYVKPGWANILERHDIAMVWPNIREPLLLQHLNSIKAMGQPFHVGIWKPVFEAYDGDGVRKDFYLQRRLLTPYVTAPTDWPEHATRVVVYDKPFSNAESPFAGEPGPTTQTTMTIVDKTRANIDTGSPTSGEAWLETDGHVEGDRWLTKVRLGDAPPEEHDCLLIQYLPMYRVVINVEDARSYREVLTEPRGFKFMEL